MAHIFPFKAIMPAKGLEPVVSANIHVDDANRQKEIVNGNPLTYLNVVKPHLKTGEEKNPDVHFPLSKIALDDLMKSASISQLNEDAFFIYKQTQLNTGNTFLGLVCTVSVEDYYSGHIKIHEKTITSKEDQLIKHIEISGVIGEPVLLTHMSNAPVIDLLENSQSACELISEFTDEANTSHWVYKVSDMELISTIKNLYLNAGDLYIADGHHRSAASAGFFRKNQLPNGRYLAYLVPPEYLKIDSFHRAFKSDADFDAPTFLKSLESDFDIRRVDGAFQPVREHEFGLCILNEWYCLDYKNDCSSLNAVDKLDVSLLEEMVFKKILHIKDSKTDKRLEFLKGNVPLSKVENDVQSNHFDFVFTVYPCTVEEVFEIADNNMIMPPKSTFMEPKLRTGLFVQSVRDSI